MIEFAKETEIPYPMILGYPYVEAQFDELATKPDTYYLFDRDGKLASCKNGFSKMDVESLIKSYETK